MVQESILVLDQIEKKFEDTPVLKGISLDIQAGEFITLLGPSGCGKTTTLRIVAGLEEPDSGRILLEGQDVTDLSPNKRDVNTVFQNYALFPHMNVEDNISYSLRIRRSPSMSKSEIKQKVKDVLELVQLTGFEKRMPQQLSGGQRQRVAIARAVINQPKVLLLDEPLGALDLQLRHQMQVELKQLQKRLGITFVYITHDQEEAINMSDRIVIMRAGQFEQIGTPTEIYNQPNSVYVAEFIGSANILKGRVVKKTENMVTFQNENGTGLVVPVEGQTVTQDEVTVAIRGEHLKMEPHHVEGRPCLGATVKETNFAGGSTHVVLRLKDGTEITSYFQGLNCPVHPGDTVCATWEPEEAMLIEEGSHGE